MWQIDPRLLDKKLVTLRGLEVCSVPGWSERDGVVKKDHGHVNTVPPDLKAGLRGPQAVIYI